MRPAGAKRRKVVVLGMMTKMPVAGVVWQTIHYVLGLERLGYEAYYVETHARTPSMLMRREDDDSSLIAANFIARTLRRFDLGDRWAFRALHDDGRCYGMSERELERLIGSAELLVNLHGGTEPLPELAATGRLVYVETDPVQLQLELHANRQETIDFLEPHCAFFTFGENMGNPDCALPVPQQFDFHPTRQPVVLDLWADLSAGPGRAFTSIGNWRQDWRDVQFHGETYTWSKHHEFLKLIDLPERSGHELELALSSLDKGDRQLLERKGWRVREAMEFSEDLDAYRGYIAASRGEFTVAKDQNVRLRSGWFSDRAATYLAAGRPVITQETGFSNVLPTGAGLFAFADIEEAIGALDAVEADHERHCAAAEQIAQEWFAHDVVLSPLLAAVDVALRRPRQPDGPRSLAPFPNDMLLTTVSRRPTRLPRSTVEIAMRRSAPPRVEAAPLDSDGASIVVVTYENLVFTRLCLESVLANTRETGYELVVVDNGSGDDTPEYLATLAERNSHVRVILNGGNLGFAPAANEGLALARGEHLVVLNNDTLVPPAWLPRLLAHLDDEVVGLVGPVTNRIGNEAEVRADYRTWAEFLRFSEQRAIARSGEEVDIQVAAMFCLAMRRDVHEQLGPLDERYEIGLLEDDDYSERARRAGYHVRCADDVFVHHFSEASFGKLVPTGEYAELLRENKRRYAEKWGAPWRPYARRQSTSYRVLTQRIRDLVAERVPPRSRVLVVSRGDDQLLSFDGRIGFHFPQADSGVYAGHYPGNSREAIAHLEQVRRAQGAQFLLFPETGLWWLDHYAGLRSHLDTNHRRVAFEEGTAVIYSLQEPSNPSESVT
ncbi:MAG: glycosyltransferase family 2 protein [Actinomycetota bacterium]